VLRDLNRLLDQNPAAIQLMRAAADEEARSGAPQAEQFRHAISPEGIGKILSGLYTGGSMVNSDGVFEKVMGVPPISCLLLGVAHQYYTSTTPEVCIKLLDTANNLNFLTQDQDLDVIISARQLPGAINAVTRGGSRGLLGPHLPHHRRETR
jgi:hypothetical protein